MDNYLIERSLRVALIYEGETEDTVIKMIFDALNVDEKRDGIFLWNASGQGNINNSWIIRLKKVPPVNDTILPIILWL